MSILYRHWGSFFFPPTSKNLKYVLDLGRFVSFMLTRLKKKRIYWWFQKIEIWFLEAIFRVLFFCSHDFWYPFFLQTGWICYFTVYIPFFLCKLNYPEHLHSYCLIALTTSILWCALGIFIWQWSFLLFISFTLTIVSFKYLLKRYCKSIF